MRTKIIFVLAMLCFLVATAAAGMLGWDPAEGIMAEDMLPEPTDLTDTEAYDSYDAEEEIAAPLPGELRLPDAIRVTCYPDLPTPQLTLTGTEDYATSDGQFTRYKLSVTNWEEYPEAFFQPAPDLPPCGSNTNSSRSWVNIYDSSDNHLYGFCALSTPADLNNLWFAVIRGETPPRSVYIVIEDRKCNSSFRSNAISISNVPGTPESSLSAPIQLSPANGSVFAHYPRSTTF